MSKNNKTILQGITIIDIHSINKKKSIEILLNSEFLKQTINQCLWEA